MDLYFAGLVGWYGKWTGRVDVGHGVGVVKGTGVCRATWSMLRVFAYQPKPNNTQKDTCTVYKNEMASRDGSVGYGRLMMLNLKTRSDLCHEVRWTVDRNLDKRLE